MKEGYDVAMVGASIAGCAAATLFARRGARVALIERRSDPDAYKTLCTHFIQPSAVPTMERRDHRHRRTDAVLHLLTPPEGQEDHRGVGGDRPWRKHRVQHLELQDTVGRETVWM
jgi:2-polyprenyl-6-methoxyphenol hydroxylase-like FAD-dependent oxidoreductase